MSDTFDDLSNEEAPAASGSPLSSLRQRRQDRKKKLKLDLKVPGYDPAVFVRFKPVDQSRIVTELKKAEKSKDRDAITLANAALLIDACVGVFQLDQDGEEISIDPENLSHDEEDWPKFDQRLGELLADDSETFNRASDVARALYDNDVALVAAAGRLYDWSQTMNEEIDREYGGN